MQTSNLGLCSIGVDEDSRRGLAKLYSMRRFLSLCCLRTSFLGEMGGAYFGAGA